MLQETFVEVFAHHFGKSLGKFDAKGMEIVDYWKRKEAILEMLNDDDPFWRDKNWVNAYYRYYMKNFLAWHSDGAEIPCYEVDNTHIDYFEVIPWFIRTSIENDNSGARITLGDFKQIDFYFDVYYAIGIFLATGCAKYEDDDSEFQKWYKKLLKDNPQNYGYNEKLCRDIDSIGTKNKPISSFKSSIEGGMKLLIVDRSILSGKKKDLYVDANGIFSIDVNDPEIISTELYPCYLY